MRWPRGSPRAWVSAVVVCAAVGMVVAGFVRREVFSLGPEDHARSIRRFVTGVREVEIDARLPWVRVPEVLPGPADTWAGGTAHAVTFLLGQRPVRPLVLYVDGQDALAVPARGDPGPLEAVDSATAAVPPATLTVAVQGTVLTTAAPWTRRDEPGHHRRYRVEIPARALGDGSKVRLSLINDSGPALALERVRLVDAVSTFAWVDLGRHGRFPVESAVFLAAGLGTLLVWNLGGAERDSWWKRLGGAAGPAAGLILLGMAVMRRTPSVVSDIPRWWWPILPLLLLTVRPRHWEPATWRRARVILVNGALALVALAVSLGAAEWILRFAFRSERSAGHGGTYFQKHVGDRKHVGDLNSLGFNEREFPLDKLANVYRIAVLGDSLSISAPRPHRFGNVIARYLNEKRTRGVTYEAVSFGRTGADTTQELDILRTFVWEAHPDFVLLEWYINDFENGEHVDRPYPSPLIPWENQAGVLLRRSALYSLLQKQWEIVQEKLGLIITYPEYMYRRFGDPEGQYSMEEVDLLRDFIEECRKRNTPVSIVLFPHVDETLVKGQYDYDYLHDRVLQVCHDENIACVDLRSTFAAYADYKQLWVHRRDPHPNALGHRLAAERLMAALGPGWLEGRQGVSSGRGDP